MSESYRPEIHGTRIIKSQFLSGVCAICNKNRIFLRNIQRDYFKNGIIENYKKMLLTCFNIRLFNSSGKPVEICEPCISRLRDAYSFRKKVEAAGKSVYHRSLKNSELVKNSQPSTNKSIFSKTKENIVSRSSSLAGQSKESVTQIRQLVKNSQTSTNKSILSKTNEKIGSRSNSLVGQSKESVTQIRDAITKTLSTPNTQKSSCITSSKVGADYSNHFEDDTLDDRSIIEVLSDGESSTTSEQIKIATGYWKEIELRKKWTRFVVPRLDFSCKTCPVCNKTFETHMKLFPHYENHFPNYLCQVCGVTFVKLSSFSAHLKIHSGTKYPCKLCKRVYASQNSVYQHVKVHHQKLKLFRCYECKERFSSSVTRRRHLSLTHGIDCATHPCKICGKIFYSAHTNKVHIQKFHQKLRNVACPVCDQRFFAKQGLKDHMATHTDIKNYHCDFCGKAFCRKKSLTEHLKIHNNIKKHKCEICEKAFVQKCALKSHVRIHTKDF